MKSIKSTVIRNRYTSKSPLYAETTKAEENTSTNKTDDPEISPVSETETLTNSSENTAEDIKETELSKECEFLKDELNETELKNMRNSKEAIEDSMSKDDHENSKTIETITKEVNSITDCEVNDDKIQEENDFIENNAETIVKKENFEETLKNEEVKENKKSKDDEVTIKIKVEPKKEEYEAIEEECKTEKEEVKKEIEIDTSKKGSIESAGNVEELDEEEPTLSKLSGGRAMKTYSKKQNATVDSEPENETCGETADYRAWKKSMMLVYNRLATHRYASIFLRPITEDQAPGYHSIIFRPMDLWTIKKNIDNGTIRSTTHFQRDVMLMFQNAIMFNKHNTRIHKMTLEMQEECLQHMQVLVRAAGEASFRRETRTAASISNEAADSSLKRKWTHITSSPHETESLRMKKRRKSEND